MEPIIDPKDAVASSTPVVTKEDIRDIPGKIETNEPSEAKKKRLDELIELLRDFVVILILVLIVRTFIGAPFIISGSSMESSYHDKEIIIVDKLSYLSIVGSPSRGDVVIFRPHADNGREFYIKRVIGLSGDIVKFQDGDVFVKKAGQKDFVQLKEDYLNELNKGKTFLPSDVKETEFTVPAGSYFLMGDNRNNSSDSRSCFSSCAVPNSHHFVKQDDILGKLFLDFGYLSFFNENTGKFGKPYWLHQPRFFGTPSTWNYTELDLAQKTTDQKKD